MIHSHGIQVFYSLMKIENKNEPNNTSSEYTLHVGIHTKWREK